LIDTESAYIEVCERLGNEETLAETLDKMQRLITMVEHSRKRSCGSAERSADTTPDGSGVV